MGDALEARALLVLLVAALAATAARLAAPTQAHPTKPSRALICGSERWRVKTLQDRPKLYSAKPKTVAWLMGLTRPKPAPKDRSNFERHIYSVEAAVTDVLQEADKDLHVVLEDGPAHMVAESPNAPFCSVDATAYRKKQMAKARDKVKVCQHARIVGVVFWDRRRRLLGSPAQRHRQGPEHDRAAPDPRLRLLLRLVLRVAVTGACILVVVSGCGGSSHTDGAAQPRDPGCKKAGIRYAGRSSIGPGGLLHAQPGHKNLA